MGRIVRIFLSIVTLCLAFSCTQHGKGYVTLTGFAQGGTYAVKFNTEGVEVPLEEIRDSIDAILVDIDNSLSGYNRNSLLSRFNAGETIYPDAIFIDMYTRAYDVFDQTGGVVDAASAPLFDIWGFGFANRSFPTDDEVRATMQESGMRRLARETVRLMFSLAAREISWAKRPKVIITAKSNNTKLILMVAVNLEPKTRLLVRLSFLPIFFFCANFPQIRRKSSYKNMKMCYLSAFLFNDFT